MKARRHTLAKLIADKIDANKVNEKQIAQEIAAYLLVEGRSGELDSLMRDVMQIRAERGTLEVTAASAHELDASEKSQVETELKSRFPAAQQVIISDRRDPELLGGVQLELANHQLDLSVRAKLNRFKQLTTARGNR